MKSWRSPDIYRPISRNVIFYDGPSQLNGEPILGIATAQNGNRKIGHMLQLWIVPGISPIAAVKTGADDAVCGDCRHRGDGAGQQRSCYVEHWRSVENIWQARGKATVMTPTEFGRLTMGLQLRIGAYGDPVAIPLTVWHSLLMTAEGWTAYTHQWKHKTALPYRDFCMASVDTEDEQSAAAVLGWRTYRVRPTTVDKVLRDEIVCPASEEGGHKAVCANCELCRGASRPAKNVVIAAHGSLKLHFIRQSERLGV